MTEQTCAGCDAVFESKTKLFNHLDKNPRHAALKAAAPASSSSAAGAKSGGGGGKKKKKK